MAAAVTGLAVGGGASQALVIPVHQEPVAALAVPAASPPTCFGRQATIVGTEDAEVIVGTVGPDVIVGGGGRDVIRGLAGRDYLCRGHIGDPLHDPVIRGGRGDDHLHGTVGALWGGPGDDMLVTRGGAMAGGQGDDTLLAPHADGNAVPGAAPGPGRDLVSGTIFRLGYSTAPGPVRINLLRNRAFGQGVDRIRGIGYLIAGSAFDDIITGDHHANEIWGNGGDDVMYGRRGDDQLWEDHDGGSDVGYGGPGGDSCLNVELRFSCPLWND